MAVSKALIALATVVLAGCTAPVAPGHWAAPTHTWRGWQATWDEATGWREWFPHYEQRKALARENNACVLVDTEGRTISQDGINDYVDYQLCYNTPYALANGQRLDGR